MRKTNLFVLTLLNLSILIVITISLLTQSMNAQPPSVQTIKETDSTMLKVEYNRSLKPDQTHASNSEPTATPSEKPIYTIDETNTLFIGDSRTVGLMQYSKNETIDYFADVGMSLYKIYDYRITLKDKGTFNIEQCLSNHTYQTIFVMLGLNDLGYNFESLCNEYAQFIQFIGEQQPSAKIILVQNLHLTSSRSETDPIFNNTNINRFNDFIASLSNETTIYTISTNHYYDDQYGNLDNTYSSDNTHLFAKYYEQWLQQILQEACETINA